MSEFGVVISVFAFSRSLEDRQDVIALAESFLRTFLHPVHVERRKRPEISLHRALEQQFVHECRAVFRRKEAVLQRQVGERFVMGRLCVGEGVMPRPSIRATSNERKSCILYRLREIAELHILESEPVQQEQRGVQVPVVRKDARADAPLKAPFAYECPEEEDRGQLDQRPIQLSFQPTGVFLFLV